MPKPPEIRKKKQLEIFLEKVPHFSRPNPMLEQYRTPAPVAADIIFDAFNMGDVFDKDVIDLGCGTGMFAAGASVMGAASVTAVDVDETAVEAARQFAEEFELDIDFRIMEAGDVVGKYHAVLQNPPFGAQTKKADRVFLETATDIADVVYTIHNSNTISFIKLMVGKLGFSVGFEKNYLFRLEHTFDFHRKEKVDHNVTLLRLERDK